MSMDNSQIKLVLFDLGGVLVELGDELFPRSWIPEGQNFGLKEWFASDIAIQFETGLISSGDFISGLKQRLSKNVSDQELLSAFERWPKKLFSSTDELLNRLKIDYKIAVLSNSNEVHEPILMREFGLQSRIEDVFFSHIIGHSKPSKEAFKHVLTTLGFEPHEVIFFDDSSANIIAAQRLGIQAYQVSSPLDVSNYI